MPYAQNNAPNGVLNTKPMSNSVIAQKMATMDFNLDQLRETIIKLSTLLEPVLMPELQVPQKDPEKDVVATDCPLAMRLDVINKKLLGLTIRVAAISGRQQVTVID